MTEGNKKRPPPNLTLIGQAVVKAAVNLIASREAAAWKVLPHPEAALTAESFL
jgi:hypothetical protein